MGVVPLPTREEHLVELRRLGQEALTRWGGNMDRATCMLALIASRRVYLADALIYEFLQRLKSETPGAA